MYSSTSSSLLSPSSRRERFLPRSWRRRCRDLSRGPSSARNRPYFAGCVLNAASGCGFLQPALQPSKQHLRRAFFLARPATPRVRARAFQVLSGVFVLPAPLAPALVKLFSFSSLSSRRRACVAPDAADTPHSTHERAPDDAACDETKSKPGGIYRERRQRYKNSRKKAWKKRWGQTHGR